MLDRMEMTAAELQPLERLPGVTEGALYLLPVSGFPIPRTELQSVREFCESLIGRTKRTKAEWQIEVIVKQSCLYAGLLDAFVDNAARWAPQQGVGVIPHKPPPHVPTREEIEGVDPRFIDQNNIGASIDVPELVFRIAQDEGKEECRATMIGHGALHIVLSSLSEKKLYQRWQEVFGGRISDRLFRAMPFFAPLLGRQSFQGASEEEIATWFESFDLYVGESKEDQGIVIAAKENLDLVMVDLVKQLPGPRFEPEIEVLRW